MGRKSRTKRARPYKRDGRKPSPKQKFTLRSPWAWAAGLGVLIVAAAVGSFFSEGPSVYPPTTIVGHVETYPKERISTTTPIPVAVQKHILEHVPVGGGERPGVIIQYNCAEFQCDEDLVPNLVAIARRYEYVYLAPYPEMDAKIALSAHDDLLTLDEYEREEIIAFIEKGEGERH